MVNLIQVVPDLQFGLSKFGWALCSMAHQICLEYFEQKEQLAENAFYYLDIQIN